MKPANQNHPFRVRARAAAIKSKNNIKPVFDVRQRNIISSAVSGIMGGSGWDSLERSGVLDPTIISMVRAEASKYSSLMVAARCLVRHENKVISEFFGIVLWAGDKYVR